MRMDAHSHTQTHGNVYNSIQNQKYKKHFNTVTYTETQTYIHNIQHPTYKRPPSHRQSQPRFVRIKRSIEKENWISFDSSSSPNAKLCIVVIVAHAAAINLYIFDLARRRPPPKTKAWQCVRMNSLTIGALRRQWQSDCVPVHAAWPYVVPELLNFCIEKRCATVPQEDTYICNRNL